MKVLLLSNLFPTSTDPNRGLFTAQLAREMASLCELRVAVPLPWAPSGRLAARLLPARYREFSLLEPTWSVNGVRADYPRYPMIPKLSERWQAGMMRSGLRGYLARLRREFEFDVINAHWLYPDGVAAAGLACELGVPVVLTGLGCDVNEFLHDATKRHQIREALEHADAITVVSQELRTELALHGFDPTRITAIPNGVDTRRFAPRSRSSARQSLGLQGSAPLIACVSRLSHEKGVHVLVEAAATLLRQAPDARIVVVGEGSEREALAARISALGIEHAVRLAGAVPHAEVATWLAAADVVCMPSLREGHPNAAMEALACGRPLVASRVGALRSLITEDLGLLVEPMDAAGLARALTAALLREWDPGRIAASVAGESWTNAAGRYVSVLQSVVATQAGH